MSNISDEKRLKLAYQMILSLEKKLEYSKGSFNQKDVQPKAQVAVVGVACQYPDGISGPSALWDAFKNKKNAVKEIPKSRWNIDDIYSIDRSEANKTYCRKGAFFDSIDKFDSLFFNISHKEAERMDPQQRLFLQGCWEAFEDAGFNDKVLSGQKCGVYAGSLNCDYTNVLNATPHDLDLFELMGTQASILSARISYLLNLKGPSITIDTACSSSLIAIDLAVKAIQQGDIDVALAGGVHLYVTPNLYVMMSKAQMLSEDGQCKAFDNSANGFAPGEGMGVVVLKSLEKAIEDRDQIYGVILGGFSNQDGKTNGIVAPSSLSQTALQQEAYNRLNLNPETIGYIEAHGTGTKLGDPIEFEALSTAFRKYTDKKQFCAIGSSKTNFGHTLSAAGVTGLLKALLAMKNKKIPGSLHFHESNEHLEYAESPFFVNTDMIEWPSQGDIPRRSAVSSFGFSGTNVHLVLEEAPEFECSSQSSYPHFYFIPLSAKTKNSLAHKVSDLKSWLHTQTFETNLADISLTLLRGRSHFRYRTAFIAKNQDELEQALSNWKENDHADISDQAATSKPTDDTDGNALIESLRDYKNIDASTYQAKLKQLQNFYLGGSDLKWSELLAKANARTITLPTYPFEKEKHWISAPAATEISSFNNSESSDKNFLFVDSNESTLESQCYQKTFTGDEFYLKDHVVNLHKMLPGVAYLEMARSSGNLCNQPYKVTKIENVVWKNPIIVDGGPQTVKISLHPEQDKVKFQIFSTTGDDAKGTIHSTGNLTYSLDTETNDEFINVAALRNELVNFMSQQQCYQIFSDKGLLYGSSFKRILDLSYKDNRALATIEGLENKSESDTLHPGIMDAALQAVLVLVSQFAKNQQQYLPYTIESLELKNPLTQRCLSYVARRDKIVPEDPSELFDIILTDENGKVLLHVKGLRLIPVKRKLSTFTSNTESLYFNKLWQQSDIKNSDRKTRTLKSDQDSSIHQNSPLILFGHEKSILESVNQNLLNQYLPIISVVYSDQFQRLDAHRFTVNPGDYNDIEKLVSHFSENGINPEYIVDVFDTSTLDSINLGDQATTNLIFLTSLVKSLMHKRIKKPIKFISLYRNQVKQQTLCSAISAFYKSLQLENPNYIGKYVEISDNTTDEQATHCLLDEILNKDLNPQPVRYSNNMRLVSVLEKVDIASHLSSQAKNPIHYSPNDVYLITGGSQGIGLAVAKHICKHHQSRLMLIGRSVATPALQKKLLELNSVYESERIIYMQADVSKLSEVEHVISEIKLKWGALNGIIHSAGINQDAFILKQDTNNLQSVLKAKVQGTLNLHQASTTEPLKFFILFSSIASVFGNSGQSNYAFANGFMDDFANYRQDQHKQGICSGKTISINWPLWQEGGMQLDSSSDENMKELFGMVAINSKAGNKVIEHSLNLPFSNLLYILGDETKIERTLFRNYAAEGGIDNLALEQLDVTQKKRVKQESERFLKLLLSDEMKIPFEKIESCEPFEKYGMDSVVYMALNRKLEAKFGKISKTLFYEYQNIASLASYFVENHLPKLIEITDVKFNRPAISNAATEKNALEEDLKPREHSRFISSPSKQAPVNGLNTSEVAIVGISGRYPMANNLEEFWSNLIQGKDCIQEIPKDRWDHSRYFNPERGTPGKTYSKWGGFIDGHNAFDPLFFNISPKEAALIDPQERVFLQTVWQAIADAGYTGKSLSNSQVGVYAGVMWSQYQLLGVDPDYESGNDVPESLISSVANRISYFFDFQGPSIGLDTMCSSSLTAIHLASEAIKNGECEYAIAGGVNLIVHPNKYLRLSQGDFSSSDGRCRSFGNGGDGYVPGEGVGAVLLKPLNKALQDRDYIHGVIKSSYINHGGKTNGYTVPNPVLQGDLIKKALEKANIDSKTISYVEAHGTGTALGDPIEITGLTQGFNAKKDKNQFCALGSVKSNIGHLESAAGVSALTKVLLQMKHKKLVPTIHCDEVNPNIDLENTPFYLQKSFSDWKKPIYSINGSEQECPRRAAISSFGAGGANAHLIVEEPSPIVRPAIENEQPGIFVFSAKDQDRLKGLASAALSYFEKPNTQTEIHLQDIAYTLQVGRDEYSERLAIVADSFVSLCEELQQFLNDQERSSNAFHASTITSSTSNDLLLEGESGLDFLKSLIKHQEFKKIAALWVQGGCIDWNLLYGDALPHRTPLPTAPFQNSVFWIPKKTNESAGKERNSQNALHALVDINTSTFEKQSYQKTFNGQEFYLRDHIIKGEKILPASVYIEMVRATANLANSKTVSGFSNIKWLNPLTVKENPTTAHINLFPENDQVDFDVVDEQNSVESTLYCSGIVNYCDSPTLPNSVEQINFTRISEILPRTIEPHEFYSDLKQKGFHYGDCFRALDSIHFNDSTVLAKVNLTLASSVNPTEFSLHPITLDAAFQAMVPLLNGRENKLDTVYLPYSIASLKMYGSQETVAYVYGEYVPSTNSGNNKIFNIKLLDSNGYVLVNITEFCVMPLVSQVTLPNTVETLFFKEQWLAHKREVNPVDMVSTTASTLIFNFNHQLDTRQTNHISIQPGESYSKHDSQNYTLPLDNKETYSKLLDDLSDEDNLVQNVIYSVANTEKPEELYLQIITSLIYLLQAVSQSKKNNPLHIFVLYPRSETIEAVYFSSLSGFLKTLYLENPLWQGKTVSYPSDFPHEQLLKKLEEVIQCAPYGPHEIHLSSDKNENSARKFTPINTPSTLDESPSLQGLKKNGVYLITGGAGGLGLLFAGYLTKTYSAKLILIGRSKLNQTKLNVIQELNNNASEVIYLQADVSSKESMQIVLEKAHARFGTINGIIHSAGINRDNFIIKKPIADFKTVFFPKVQGSLILDEVTANEKLDLFVMFSSITSVIGNAGQADYATANAFQDSFASHRNHMVTQQLRHGRTLSINWPLWREGGMQLSHAMIDELEKSLGLSVLDSEDGFKAFEQALRLPYSEIIIARGIKQRLTQLFANEKIASQAISPQATHSNIDKNELKKSVTLLLKELISAEIRWPVEKISDIEPFGSYGIDSVMTLNLTSKLSIQFGEQAKTLFFEYPTISQLCNFLIDNYAEKAELLISSPANKEAPEKSTQLNVAASMAPRVHHRAHRNSTSHRFIKTSSTESIEHDIAIIGISGRYPQANNIEDFYQNLVEGKDCITEIPKARWDCEADFDENRNRVGKCYSKWGGFLNDIDKFDPLFFNISPTDAITIDPQERLFLESVWNTIEDAAYTKASLAEKKVGVFAGVMWDQYQLFGLDGGPTLGKKYPGSSYASIANRVSYWFNFDGPSLSVDTMCSSSLTAIHYACESIKRAECDVAIAGGVNLSLHHLKYLQLAGSQFLSTDGKCRSFGEGGDGYVPGEGVGSILLKSLSQAQLDGDHIHAVIRGSAVNHNGKSNGFNVPSPIAQGKLIQSTLQAFSINPRDISYAEAHGTGTPIGDPIEIQGLKRGFADANSDEGYCTIGSVKSNIGHLEAASGMAGLTKVILQMKHKQLFPSLHSESVNPNIDLSKSPFVVQKGLSNWLKTENKPYLATISSFGAGGSNAFLIVESISQQHQNTSSSPYPYQIIPLSAKTPTALKQGAKQLADFIKSKNQSIDITIDHINLENIAFTLQRSRESMGERLVLVSNSLEDLADKLTRFYEQGIPHENTYIGSVDIVASQSLPKIENAIKDDLKNSHKALTDAALLWVKGQAVDFSKVLPELKASRISLPTYCFQRKSYWYSGEKTYNSKPHLKASLIDDVDLTKSTAAGLTFKKLLTPSHPLLSSHLFQQQPLLPGTAYLEMVSEAINTLSTIKGLTFKNVSWNVPLFVKAPSVELLITLTPIEEGYAYEIWTEQKNDKVIHSKGSVQPLRNSHSHTNDIVNVSSFTTRDLETMEKDDFYQCFTKYSIQYHNDFKCIDKTHLDQDIILAEYSVVNSRYENTSYIFNPAILDSALQTFVLLQDMKASNLKLPFSVDSISLIKPPSHNGLTLSTQSRTAGNKAIIADIEGNPCVVFTGINFREVKHLQSNNVSQQPTSKKLAQFNTREECAPNLSVERLVKNVFGKKLNIKSTDLKTTTTFEQYGVESVMAVEITKALEVTFGDLQTTLLFEYQTIGDLINYFIADHASVCAQLTLSNNNAENKTVAPQSREEVSDANKLLTTVEKTVKSIFSRQLNIDLCDLKSSVDFEQYGMESVSAMEITKALEKYFGSLPATTLFEYQSISKLSEFLLEEFPDQCDQLSTNFFTTSPVKTEINTHRNAEKGTYIQPLMNTDDIRHTVNALNDSEVDKLLNNLLGKKVDLLMEQETNEP